MAARFTDIEQRIKHCRLSGRSKHGGHTAFKRSDFGSYTFVRRILQTGIKKSGSLEIEQFAHLITRFIFECRTLIDRQYTRFAVFRLPASLHTDRTLFLFLHLYFDCLLFEGQR